MASEELLAAILPRLDRALTPDGQWPDRSGEYRPLCPFHEDTRPGSFSVSVRGFSCFACRRSGTLRELARHLGLAVASGAGLTLHDYAEAKRIPVGFLRGLGVREITVTRGRYPRPALAIPYLSEDRQPLRVRHRLALTKPTAGRDAQFRWAQGKGIHLYGLWRLPEIRACGWVLLVEGESDCHAAWLHHLPAIGVPGASAWRSEWAALLAGLDVYVWREPDAGGATFVDGVAASVPGVKVVIPPLGVKDLSELHVRHGGQLPVILEQL